MLKINVPLEDRPRCIVEGCNNPAHHTGQYRVDGTPKFRKRCQHHHAEHSGQKKGLSPREWLNSYHPYLHQRKDYCDNIDGRLGFFCTTTILLAAQLEVDHIDGNHLNNDPENLQTLCGCCHKYKTIINEDWKTPGRKTRNSLSKDLDSPD